MNELVSKMSSYNIFNYLVPGAAFCCLMETRAVIDLGTADIATRLVIFYVTGMAISRMGSLVIDPVLKRTRLVARSDYSYYFRVSTCDDKIPILLETSNTYRTMASAFFLAVGGCIASLILPRSWLRDDVFVCLTLAGMGMLFVVAYVKQNKAVTRRVDAAMNSSNVAVPSTHLSTP